MNGPSVTLNLPPDSRRRVPLACSAPVVTNTPDCIASPTNLPISSISPGLGGVAFSGSKLGSYTRNCMIFLLDWWEFRLPDWAHLASQIWFSLNSRTTRAKFDTTADD